MSPSLYPGQRKQVAALTAGIKVLKDWRRRHYACGEAAYQCGDRGLTFIEDGHRHFQEYSEHIKQLEDLIEILTDPGVTVNPLGDLPLFDTATLEEQS